MLVLFLGSAEGGPPLISVVGISGTSITIISLGLIPLSTSTQIASESPINTNLYIKIFNFKSYQEIQKVLEDLNLTINSTTERKNSKYNLIIGPIKNEEADKLVSSFIMKGYKKTEIILK